MVFSNVVTIICLIFCIHQSYMIRKELNGMRLVLKDIIEKTDITIEEGE